ncbi:MAG: glycosyltransferase [Cuniculiplasma sp.]
MKITTGIDDGPQLNTESMIIVYASEHQNIIRKTEFVYKIASDYFSASIYRIPTKDKRRYIFSSLKLVFKIYKERIKNIFLVEFVPALSLVLFFRILKTRFLYWSGNINYDILRTLGYKRLLVELFRLQELFIIRKSDIIFSDSMSMINFFSLHNKDAPKYYLPEYLENISYQNISKSNKYYEEIAKDDFVVGYIGKMHLVTINHQSLPRGWELVEVCSKLVESGIFNVTFLIIGDGPGLSILRDLVLSHNLSGFFEFTTYVNDETKIRLLKTIDIGFCEDYKSYLTHRFNLSSKIQEYMCLGVPVVTGNQGDKGVLIGDRDHPCGVCIAPLEDNSSKDQDRYVKDLSNAIIQMKNGGSILNKMSYNCIAKSLELFSKKSITNTLCNAFNTILENCE